MTDDQPIPSAPQSQNDPKNNATNPNGDAIPEVKVPPSHAEYKISCHKKRDKWDIAKLVAEFLGIIFLIIYTLYTAGIYRANKSAAQAARDTLGEIQKQTKLIRQQIVNAQQAVIGIWFNVTEDSLVIMPTIEGQAPARDVHVEISITRKTFPNLHILNTEPVSLDWPLVRNVFTGPASPTDMQTLHKLANLGESSKREWNAGKQAVFVDYRFHYNNGFDDILNGSGCTFYLRHPNTTGGIDTETHTCDQLDIWVQYHKEHDPK